MNSDSQRMCDNKECESTALCAHGGIHDLAKCISSPSCKDGCCREVTSYDYETNRIKNKGW